MTGDKDAAHKYGYAAALSDNEAHGLQHCKVWLKALEAGVGDYREEWLNGYRDALNEMATRSED